MATRFRHWSRAGMAAAVSVAAGLVLVACGGGGGNEKTTVDVALQEFSVTPAQDSAPAGSITFDVTNTGPNEVHEFVVLKTDVAAEALPTDENGAAQEEAEGIEPVDEIEDIAVGDSTSLTVDLEPGSYVFVCNIWDPEQQEAHYRLGMRTAFTVD